MPINYVYGSNGHDIIVFPTTDGVDYVFGYDGMDSIHGKGGDDFLFGGNHNDVLHGDGDNDTLKGGGGADDLFGGSGNDTAVYDDSPAGVTVSLISNMASGGDAAGDEFDSIENLRGSFYADTLLGDNGNNELHGLNGNDTLKGYGGHDTLWGGFGNDFLYGMDSSDTLYGGDGNDHLNGGAYANSMHGGTGNDVYILDAFSDSVHESGGEGIDIVRTSASWIMSAGADIEVLETTNVTGTAAINLFGNASGNQLIGNDGDNILGGGGGSDEMIGNGGADSFLFNTALSEVFNIDLITDFNVADDTIQLDDDIFSSSLAVGNSVAGSQFVIGTAALDAGDRIIYDAGTGAVYYDSDGVGGAAQIQFAQLSAGLALTNFDFFVVA